MEDKDKKDLEQLSDEDLIERFQQGDANAYELIVKRYKNQLLNFVFRFLGNQEEAEDVVQETFLRVFRNRFAYTRVAKLSTWSYTMSRHLSRTVWRRGHRRIWDWKTGITKLPTMF